MEGSVQIITDPDRGGPKLTDPEHCSHETVPYGIFTCSCSKVWHSWVSRVSSRSHHPVHTAWILISLEFPFKEKKFDLQQRSCCHSLKLYKHDQTLSCLRSSVADQGYLSRILLNLSQISDPGSNNNNKR